MGVFLKPYRGTGADAISSFKGKSRNIGQQTLKIKTSGHIHPIEINGHHSSHVSSPDKTRLRRQQLHGDLGGVYQFTVQIAGFYTIPVIK